MFSDFFFPSNISDIILLQFNHRYYYIQQHFHNTYFVRIIARVVVGTVLFRCSTNFTEITNSSNSGWLGSGNKFVCAKVFGRIRIDRVAKEISTRYIMQKKFLRDHIKCWIRSFFRMHVRNSKRDKSFCFVNQGEIESIRLRKLCTLHKTHTECLRSILSDDYYGQKEFFTHERQAIEYIISIVWVAL